MGLRSGGTTHTEEGQASRHPAVSLRGLFQDTDLLSPGILMNSSHGSGAGGGGGSGSLESSRHLSRSNIDIPRSNGTEDPKRQLPRKRSDSSTYELDTIQQHQAFLSRWVGLAGAGGPNRRDGPCQGPQLFRKWVAGYSCSGQCAVHGEGHPGPEGADCLGEAGAELTRAAWPPSGLSQRQWAP